MDLWKEATPTVTSIYGDQWQPIGSIWNDISGTTLNNVFSSNEAKKAREFETYMASTAYQRLKDDLRAAGLNPALAVGNGSASVAGSPSGSAASATSAGNFGGVAHAVSKLASSAMLDATRSKLSNTAKNGGSLRKTASEIQKVTNQANSALSQSKFDNKVELSDSQIDKLFDDAFGELDRNNGKLF